MLPHMDRNRTKCVLNINTLNGKFYTNLYDKRDTFSFSIVNFQHMDSNIPSKPAYKVAISQLVRYLRICCNYQDFAYRSKLLTTRLLRQGYVYQKLCSTYKTFCASLPHEFTELREVPEKQHYRMHCLTYCLTQPEHAAYLA